MKTPQEIITELKGLAHDLPENNKGERHNKTRVNQYINKVFRHPEKVSMEYLTRKINCLQEKSYCDDALCEALNMLVKPKSFLKRWEPYLPSFIKIAATIILGLFKND